MGFYLSCYITIKTNFRWKVHNLRPSASHQKTLLVHKKAGPLNIDHVLVNIPTNKGLHQLQAFRVRTINKSCFKRAQVGQNWHILRDKTMNEKLVYIPNRKTKLPLANFWTFDLLDSSCYYHPISVRKVCKSTNERMCL